MEKQKQSKSQVKCDDINCSTHGNLSTRGILLDGIVVSDKMDKNVIVQRDSYVKVKKYERYKKSKSRISAHNPPCINAKTGDKVQIAECRRLSKTVSFVVTSKLEENG